ncbi:hypothetical protein ACFL5Q_05660 [Planctomycetota bacterium]
MRGARGYVQSSASAGGVWRAGQGMTGIEELFLYNNAQVTDAGLEHLKRLAKLRQLCPARSI